MLQSTLGMMEGKLLVEIKDTELFEFEFLKIQYVHPVPIGSMVRPRNYGGIQGGRTVSRLSPRSLCTGDE